MKKLILVTAALAATTFSTASFAQFAKADDAAKYRQGAFQVMAAHFGRVGAMVAGRVPFDAKAAQENMADSSTKCAEYRLREAEMCKHQSSFELPIPRSTNELHTPQPPRTLPDLQHA